MSLSSVCQGGLQSCLDFNFFNTLPLRPSLTESEVHNEQNKMKINDNIDMGGWSFLQSLTNSSPSSSPSSSSPPSSSKLSSKSLEMCTESLGSETGSSCSIEEMHFTSSLENGEESSPKYYKNWVTEKRMKRRTSFPPPLTSISGTSGVQLRPYREGGRLILKAESVSCRFTYFQTERSNGRLKLRLLQNCSPNCKEFESEEEEEEEEEEAAVEEIESEQIVVDDVGETEETEEFEEEENSSVKVRGEMGGKKVSMSSRCKEGGENGRKGLLNLEPFWVAS